MAKSTTEQKKADEKERFVVFRRTSPDAGYWSFNGYSIDGVHQFLFRGTDPYDPTGQRQAKFRVGFDPNQRDVRVSKKDEELIEFWKNSPECRNGPNGDGVNGAYYLYDEDAELESANKKKQVKLNANNVANSLTGEKLSNVAALYGYFGTNSNKLKNTVLSAAEADAEDFMIKVGGADLKERALFYKAEENEVIKKDGVAYIFGQTNLGSSEDEAISLLLSDKTIADAVQKALSKGIVTS